MLHHLYYYNEWLLTSPGVSWDSQVSISLTESSTVGYLAFAYCFLIIMNILYDLHTFLFCLLLYILSKEPHTWIKNCKAKTCSLNLLDCMHDLFIRSLILSCA